MVETAGPVAESRAAAFMLATTGQRRVETMEQTISITGLTQYGTAGWAWTETTDFRCLECRTNGAGAGLWVRRPGLDREFQQQRGTAQFRLPASRAAAYAKIRRDAIAGL